jgi:voltage-gated sodium channel
MLFNINRLSRLSDASPNYFKNVSNKKDFSSKSEICSKFDTKNFIISKGGEVFRQKLIDYFVPNKKNQSKKLLSITVKDLISTKDSIDEMLLKNPNELVRFATYPKINRLRLDERKRLYAKRYYNKFQNFREFLVNVFNGKYFKNFLVLLLLLDAVLIGVTVDLSVSDNKVNHRNTILILSLIQVILTILFLIESLCRIYMAYNDFFKSAWKIFDLMFNLLTIATAIFEIMNVFSFHPVSDDLHFQLILELKVFRILRLLKIISHFMQLRIIIMSLTKSFHSVFLITILLFIFACIYANVGVVLFEDMRNRIDDEYFNDCFEATTNALLTLFAIMTLDQWWNIFTYASESNENNVVSTIYFLSWILLAAFIFQNLFTGAMVNNFQEIRENIENKINRKILKEEEYEIEGIADDLKGELNENLLSEDDQLSESINSSSELESDNCSSQKTEENTINEKRRKILKKVVKNMQNKRKINKNWLNSVNKNIDVIEDIISSNKAATIWPEDTLLHYYSLMQSLMDNLHERMILLEYANNSLLLMHDRDNTMFPLSNYDIATKKNN